MIERVHEHLTGELNTNTRTDIIFVLTAIILNLITLGINAGIASSSGDNRDWSSNVIFFTFIILLLVVNLVAEIGLLKGRQTRKKLLDGLILMYKDNSVDKYYDPSLLGDYGVRYNLFMLTVLCTGLIALIVPFVLFVS